MMSSTSTLRSGKAGSVASLDSVKSGEPFSKSPRMSRRHSSMENIPEGPSESSHIYCILLSRAICTTPY